MGHRSEPRCLPAGNPGPLTGAGNNTWLVDGLEPTLIDAGVGAATHLDAIEGALAGRPLARVIVTHGHSDHAGGASALRHRWPALDICKWPADSDDRAIWNHPLQAGEAVRAGDAVFQVVYTPGHAPDHVALWDAERRALYSGDLLIQGSTVLIPAGRGGRLADYLTSLETVRVLDPGLAYPGHGPIIDRPRALIGAYLAHRRQREEQVLACLEHGISDAEQIVERLYPGLDAALTPAARVTVEAHLEKLRDEGRVPAAAR